MPVMAAAEAPAVPNDADRALNARRRPEHQPRRFGAYGSETPGRWIEPGELNR